jgi:hypothetical protein
MKQHKRCSTTSYSIHHRVSESASAMGGMTDRTELLTLASVAQALMMGEGDCLINSIDNRRIHSTRSREVRGVEVGDRRGEGGRLNENR